MLHEITFKSFNERDTVYGWIYAPAAKPKGIIQLVHGFGEHARRYLHMISDFVDHDYIVACDDHVGHGKTAIENDTWGDWGDKGFMTMVEDEKKLHDETVKLYPDLPYFIFGHSMGSIIVRQYMAKYGGDLTAATICGTCGLFPGKKEAIAMLQAKVDAGEGAKADPEIGAAVLGWMFERTGAPKIGNEWICHDPYVQIDHANDPFDAFTKPTPNQTYLYFMQMIDDVDSKDWAEKVPKTLPIYSIAGDQDPFGYYGEGVMQISNWLTQTGHDIKTRLYSGYRHEIHNYRDIRSEVEDGITDFFDAHLPA